MRFRRSRRYIPNNRGVALLLAVTVISLLVAVTVQFNRDMRRELTGSANILAGSHLQAMVKSGYNLGLAVLSEDGKENDFDTLHDSWARLAGEERPRLYAGGEVVIEITDLGGRLPVNSLVASSGQTAEQANLSQQLLRRLLTSGEVAATDDEEVDLIIAALIDWIDEDDETSGLWETESSFYLAREPAYGCRNAPMEFIEELLLVRGITRDLYYGTEEKTGLRDLLTVHGSKTEININTAPPSLLGAMDEMIDAEMVEEMLLFRGNPDNRDRLREQNWYAEIGAVPGNLDLGDRITTSSRFFEITAAAEYTGLERDLRAVVRRQEDGELETISIKVE